MTVRDASLRIAREMSNPDDYWRTRQPAPPHAPPHSKGPAGTPFGQDQPPPLNGPETYAQPVGSGAGVILLMVIFAIVFSWLIFPMLYPLAGFGASAGVFATEVILRTATHLSAEARLPIDLLAGLAIFWPLSRMDHRLATNLAPYRYARHAARLVLIAGFFTLMSLNPVAGFPRTAWQIQSVAHNPALLPLFAGSALVVHLFLVKARGIRRMWDTVLELARLRPNLPAG